MTSTGNFACLFAVLAILTVQAQACSCAIGTFEQNYKRSETVVLARVRDVHITPVEHQPCLEGKGPCSSIILFAPRLVKFTLEVIRTYRGCGPSATIFFGESSLSGASCGYSLQKGRLYMLNLYKELPSRNFPGIMTFNVNLCQMNQLFSNLSKPQKKFLRHSARKEENMCIPKSEE